MVLELENPTHKLSELPDQQLINHVLKAATEDKGKYNFAPKEIDLPKEDDIKFPHAENLLCLSTFNEKNAPRNGATQISFSWLHSVLQVLLETEHLRSFFQVNDFNEFAPAIRNHKLIKKSNLGLELLYSVFQMAQY